MLTTRLGNAQYRFLKSARTPVSSYVWSADAYSIGPRPSGLPAPPTGGLGSAPGTGPGSAIQQAADGPDAYITGTWQNMLCTCHAAAVVAQMPVLILPTTHLLLEQSQLSRLCIPCLSACERFQRRKQFVSADPQASTFCRFGVTMKSLYMMCKLPNKLSEMVGHAGADYEAAHDAVARQAETAMNGRAAPPPTQQGLPMVPPQRPPGAAPPSMPPSAGGYAPPRMGAGGPPAGAPPPYSSYPGERALHDSQCLFTSKCLTERVCTGQPARRVS